MNIWRLGVNLAVEMPSYTLVCEKTTWWSVLGQQIITWCDKIPAWNLPSLPCRVSTLVTSGNVVDDLMGVCNTTERQYWWSTLDKYYGTWRDVFHLWFCGPIYHHSSKYTEVIFEQPITEQQALEIDPLFVSYIKDIWVEEPLNGQ